MTACLSIILNCIAMLLSCLFTSIFTCLSGGLCAFCGCFRTDFVFACGDILSDIPSDYIPDLFNIGLGFVTGFIGDVISLIVEAILTLLYGAGAYAAILIDLIVSIVWGIPEAFIEIIFSIICIPFTVIGEFIDFCAEGCGLLFSCGQVITGVVLCSCGNLLNLLICCPCCLSVSLCATVSAMCDCVCCIL